LVDQIPPGEQQLSSEEDGSILQLVHFLLLTIRDRYLFIAHMAVILKQNMYPYTVFFS